MCTKFGTAVGVADVITRDKFFGDRLRGVDSVVGRKLPSPMRQSPLTQGWRYRAARDFGNRLVVILMWVDDVIVGASDNALLTTAKQMLKDKFNTKDLGKLSYFLGINFECGNGFIKMNQKQYLTRVLEKFVCQIVNLDTHPLNRNWCVMTKSDEGLMLILADPTKYREAVGSVVYALQ